MKYVPLIEVSFNTKENIILKEGDKISVKLQTGKEINVLILDVERELINKTYEKIIITGKQLE
jgi:hypothetical protein